MEEIINCDKCEKYFTIKVFQCKICDVKIIEQPCPNFKTCYKCDICHAVHSSTLYLNTHYARVARQNPRSRQCWKCHKTYKVSCSAHEKSCVPCSQLIGETITDKNVSLSRPGCQVSKREKEGLDDNNNNEEEEKTTKRPFFSMPIPELEKAMRKEAEKLGIRLFDDNNEEEEEEEESVEVTSSNDSPQSIADR